MKRIFTVGTMAMIIFAAIFASCNCGASSESAEKAMTPIDNIFERKSVRSFEDKTVSKDTLELLVKAGMAAPSAMNRQPWQFFVSTDKAKMDSLNARLPYAKCLRRLQLQLWFWEIRRSPSYGCMIAVPALRMCSWLQSLWGLALYGQQLSHMMIE